MFQNVSFQAPQGWTLQPNGPDYLDFASDPSDLRDSQKPPVNGARMIIFRAQDKIAPSSFKLFVTDGTPPGTTTKDVKYGKGGAFVGLEADFSRQTADGKSYAEKRVLLQDPGRTDTPIMVQYSVPQTLAAKYESAFASVVSSLAPASGAPQTSSSGAGSEGDLCAFAMPDTYKWAYNIDVQGRGNLCYVWVDPVPFGPTCGAPPTRPVDKCTNKGAEVTVRRFQSSSAAAAGMNSDFKCCGGKTNTDVGDSASEGTSGPAGTFGIKFQRSVYVISAVQMGTYTEQQIRALTKAIDTKIR